MSGTNLYVINGKIYSIEHVNGKWVVYMDGMDIADFPTENTAKVWINDRARKRDLSEKTNKFINNL